MGRCPPGSGAAAEQWAPKRRLYVDNLKVILIAGVIAGHAIASYSDEDFWPYAEMKEVTLSGATQLLLYAVVAPATLLMIPLLFLVAGLLTPSSVDRKGRGRSRATGCCGSEWRSRRASCCCSRC